ncbi:MAG: hypothetical protein QW815_08720, partial [Nitrososphaerota archaeon]
MTEATADRVGLKNENEATPIPAESPRIRAFSQNPADASGWPLTGFATVINLMTRPMVDAAVGVAMRVVSGVWGGISPRLSEEAT